MYHNIGLTTIIIPSLFGIADCTGVHELGLLYVVLNARRYYGKPKCKCAKMEWWKADHIAFKPMAYLLVSSGHCSWLLVRIAQTLGLYICMCAAHRLMRIKYLYYDPIVLLIRPVSFHVWKNFHPNRIGCTLFFFIPEASSPSALSPFWKLL